MGKISELKKYELQAEDVLFVVERKDKFNEIRLSDVMDKYALDFAKFVSKKDNLTDLLIEFKKNYGKERTKSFD